MLWDTLRAFVELLFNLGRCLGFTVSRCERWDCEVEIGLLKELVWNYSLLTLLDRLLVIMGVRSLPAVELLSRCSLFRLTK